MAEDGRPEELRITDPRTLRALAHPARIRVVSELFEGDELTATEAARLCGLSPSAMSYHLRALEKWGLVQRGEPTGDGRERPWRAVARGLTILPEAYRGVGAAMSTSMLTTWLGQIEDGVARSAADIAAGGEGGTLSSSRPWLTDEEMHQIRDEMTERMRHLSERTAENHPEGARAYDAYLLLLPREPLTEEASPPPD